MARPAKAVELQSSHLTKQEYAKIEYAYREIKIMCLRLEARFEEFRFVRNEIEKITKPTLERLKKCGIMEERYNDGHTATHGKDGRFTGSRPYADNDGSDNENTQLTKVEQTAINVYISSESYVINEKLRSGTPLTADEQKTVDNLDTALGKLPKYEGTVYRSLDSSVMDNPAEFWRLHQPGMLIGYSAYTSTSIEVYDETMDIQCVITSKNGKDITSFNGNEKEILFSRNTKFLVTDFVNGIIYMEEV